MEDDKRNTLIDVLMFSGCVMGLLWGILLINYFLGGTRFDLNHYGILPRRQDGLVGIPCAPFLHANASHLAANSVPLLILGWIVYALERKRMLLIVTSIIVFGGLGTWLIGNGSAVHIGASGLIYGLFGYILSAGFHNRTFKTIALAGVVLFVYGGMIWGILPRCPGVSWESHLCGLTAGVIDARYRCSRPAAVAA